MSNQLLDLAKLNATLLTDPESISKDPTVQRLAKQDPELGFLCPLARALLLLANNAFTPRDAVIALETCWLIDDSLIFKEEGWQPYDNVEGREIVRHSMQVFAGGNSFRLGFDSEAEFLFCSDEYKQLITAGTVAKLLERDSEADAFDDPGHLITWLASKAERPTGYPEGEDEPLCTISHRLTSINGIEVDGPVMNCGYHETTVDDSCGEWNKRSKPEEMCWLHALNAELADKLGIGAASQQENNRASKGGANHPAWLSEFIKIESAWLDADQLQESYSAGRRTRIQGAPIRLALGCGEDWTPQTDSEEEESCDLSSRVYPAAHPPLLNIEIDAHAGHFPDSIEKLRHCLLRLAEIAKRCA